MKKLLSLMIALLLSIWTPFAIYGLSDMDMTKWYGFPFIVTFMFITGVLIAVLVNELAELTINGGSDK